MEEEIKKIFDIKEMFYVGTVKSVFGEDLFLFKTNDKNKQIAIEVSLVEVYTIYRTKSGFISNDSYCKIIGEKYYYLYTSKRKTFLKCDGVVIKEFNGDAFDFDKELVVLRLEG